MSFSRDSNKSFWNQNIHYLYTEIQLGWSSYKQLHVNSLAHGICSCNLQLIIFKLISRLNIWNTHCTISPLRWMPQNLTNDKSSLVQGMAWCHQAPSHSLNQRWPSSMMTYGIIKPLWINRLMHKWSQLDKLSFFVPFPLVRSRSLEGPLPCEQGSKGPTGKLAWCCTSTGQDSSKELDLEWISPVVAELRWLQSFVWTNGWTDERTSKRMNE